MTDKLAAPAVVRATAILDLIAQSDSPLSLADMTRALGLPKSSLHGLCATLEQQNLITRLTSGQMTLGPHVMMWAHAFLARIDITQEFFASWDDMRVLPEDTITLSIRDGCEIVYIACRNGRRPLGFTFHTGMRLPAARTATGLAMLSTLPNQRIRALYAPESGTRASVSAPGPEPALDSLLEELRQTRQRGYSVDHEGVHKGMDCFGAPVFDSLHHEAVAGVAVSIPTGTADMALQEHAGQAMRKLAKRLSERLGCWHDRG